MKTTLIDPDPFSEEQAAVLFAHALIILDRQSDYEDERGTRAYGCAIPKTILSYGELDLIVPALLVLLAMAYPQLKDEETLASLVRAATADAGGLIN